MRGLKGLEVDKGAKRLRWIRGLRKMSWLRELRKLRGLKRLTCLLYIYCHMVRTLWMSVRSKD